MTDNCQHFWLHDGARVRVCTKCGRVEPYDTRAARAEKIRSALIWFLTAASAVATAGLLWFGLSE